KIETDADLSSAVDALRGERDVRAAAWHAMEPTDATCRRLVMKVESAIDKDLVWSMRYRKLRPWTAAAACVIIGIGIGWLVRGPAVNTPPDQFPTNAAPGIATGPLAPANERMVSFPIRDRSGRVLGY